MMVVPYIDAVENAVLNPNAFKGELPGWRHYRLEYGGHAERCLFEGTVLLPPMADVEDFLKMLNQFVADSVQGGGDAIQE